MHFKMSSAICFNLDQSKILSSGNGLNSHSQMFTFRTNIIRYCLIWRLMEWKKWGDWYGKELRNGYRNYCSLFHVNRSTAFLQFRRHFTLIFYDPTLYIRVREPFRKHFGKRQKCWLTAFSFS